jgi:glycosyltransferase involved in cell wall biosynthesis
LATAIRTKRTDFAEGRLKIAVLAETFPRNTGYFGAMFPKYLARAGVEVHLLALDLPPYWNVPSMRPHYENHVGLDWLSAGRVTEHDGYTVHIMKHERQAGFMRMRGLYSKLRDLRPDIVYSLSAIGWMALEAALYRALLGYKLFTGSHTAASTFPLYYARWSSLLMTRIKVFLSRFLLGRFVSFATERCYGPTVDCAEIAWRFFGVQKHKVAVMHLGVDTDIFFPNRDHAASLDRQNLRAEMGFAPEDIVLIYTGKLTPEKNVPILQDAARILRAQGLPFKCLVVGDGPQRDWVAKDSETRLLDYQHFARLGRFYRASDIAVWPTNESTSMLDAAACGLPLVVSDGIVYRDHVDGNGIVYRMNNLDSLVDALRQLANPELRRELGEAGARKMATSFSWAKHIDRRMADYTRALAGMPLGSSAN